MGPARPASKKGFTVLAHRGARGHAPENTLAAFDKALELGAKWIELDVQLHDGQLWVFHDQRLERCTNGQGWLVDHKAAALRALDAGNGQKIPLLHEVLHHLRGRVCVNIELKTGDGTAAAVATALRTGFVSGWKPEQFLVSSFHLPELRDFKRRIPELALGVLLCGVPLDLAGAASQLGAQVVSLDRDFADPALIKDAQDRGMKVFVFTVNEREDIARFRDAGIDGVFTDFPERAS